jgi:hypothetical protein
MVAWRICIAAGLVLAIGCGETPKPAAPSSPPAQVAANSEKPIAAEKVDTPESQAEPEPPFQLEDGFTSLALADFEAFEPAADTWEGTAEGFKGTGKPPVISIRSSHFKTSPCAWITGSPGPRH